MSKVIELNCDLDGVVYDWVKYVTTKHYPGLTQEQLNKHENRVGMLTEMYHKEPDLFFNLPLCPGAVELVQLLTRLGSQGYRGCTIHVRYLSATDTIHPNFYRAAYDKQRALERDFDIPATSLVVVLKSIQKTEYAHSHAILIDDYDKNIMAFTEHGGEGIFVPENHCHKDLQHVIMDRIDYIIDYK